MSTINLRELTAKVQEEAVVAPIEKPLNYVEREIEFNISYVTPDGKTLSSKVKSRVLDGKARNLKAHVLTSLMGGLRAEAFWADDLYRLEAISRVATQIVDIPQWLDEWCQQDTELLAKVTNILLEHETRYFRLHDTQGEGSQAKSRISIDSPFSEKA